MEKTALESKKFKAFFFAISILAIIIITALLTQLFGWAMAVFMCIGIMSISFISIGYVLSQSALDKFIQGIGMVSGIKGENDESDTKEPME